MFFDQIRDWQGTAESLLEDLHSKIEQLSLFVEAPTVKTVRSW